MTKVVINDRHGGFGISERAAEWLIENKGWNVTRWDDGDYADETAELVDDTAGPDGHDMALANRYLFVGSRNNCDIRTNSDLIECINELGDDADGKHADLKIIEIPDDIEWEIKEYDGAEWIAEKHRTWP